LGVMVVLQLVRYDGQKSLVTRVHSRSLPSFQFWDLLRRADRCGPLSVIRAAKRNEGAQAADAAQRLAADVLPLQRVIFDFAPGLRRGLRDTQDSSDFFGCQECGLRQHVKVEQRVWRRSNGRTRGFLEAERLAACARSAATAASLICDLRKCFDDV